MNLIIRLGHGNMQIPALTASLSLGINCQFIIGHIRRSCFWNSWKRELKVNHKK